MKVIIVDDEPKAIDLIASYLEHFSSFELVGTFRNGLKALDFLSVNEVDVVFLDIQMPHLSGLSLSKTLASDTAIVFTTAYSEHALESYEVNAVDYLLKPISLERFTKTISKLMHRLRGTGEGLQVAPHANGTIFLKSGLETHQVNIDDILYMKKDGNYMLYYTTSRKVMTRESIAEALSRLHDSFIQVQKSFIVHLTKVDTITTDFVYIGTDEIPIGKQYKEALSRAVKDRL